MAGVDHEVFVTPPQGKPSWPGVVDAQNMLVERALVGKFDYLWLVQADVQVPEDGFVKLFGLDVDVAQGVAPKHYCRDFICGFLDADKKVWYLPRNAVEGMVLSGWVFAGLSCTLIRRRVLKAGIRFEFQSAVGEDILFMYAVQSQGFVAKVHGSVVCGHLPEWPLLSHGADKRCEPFFEKLDVGCGHRPTGDVNVDLFPEPSAHRASDQRVNDDVALHVREIPNFVVADALHLPFRERSFVRVYSWHLIEHLENPEGFLEESCRVAAEEIEVRCPNGDPAWAYGVAAYGETKPLHVSRMTCERFERDLKAFPGWDWNVSFDFSQSEPWEIVVKGWRKGLA